LKISKKGETKIRIYKDEEGVPKGDALVSYLRPESVNLAITLLDETEFRPGYKIKVTEAKFEFKAGKKPSKKKPQRPKVDQKKYVLSFIHHDVPLTDFLIS
jgi:HIV Tat-specific factor 1